MMFEGAVVKEQGVTFAIVIVKKHVIDNRLEATKVAASFQPIFPGLPIILVAQDDRGTPTYFGRRDIAQFLASIPIQSIPWKQYTLN